MMNAACVAKGDEIDDKCHGSLLAFNTKENLDLHNATVKLGITSMYFVD